eukprot:549340-Heterocapsa_arctica.AAC.1
MFDNNSLNSTFERPDDLTCTFPTSMPDLRVVYVWIQKRLCSICVVECCGNHPASQPSSQLASYPAGQPVRRNITM